MVIFCEIDLYSTGDPNPYIQDTEAITITSLLPDNNEEVVRNLNFSISYGFIQKFMVYFILGLFIN